MFFKKERQEVNDRSKLYIINLIKTEEYLNKNVTWLKVK